MQKPDLFVIQYSINYFGKHNNFLFYFLNFFKVVMSADNIHLPLIMSYASENSKSYPFEIGADYTLEQRNEMALYLVCYVLLCK